jgi:hypothetical protein
MNDLENVFGDPNEDFPDFPDFPETQHPTTTAVVAPPKPATRTQENAPDLGIVAMLTSIDFVVGQKSEYQSNRRLN